MKYCLDTNTVIHYFRGRGQVAQRLLATTPSEVAIPAVGLYELYVGIYRSPARTSRLKSLQTLLASVTVLPFGAREAEASAGVRAALEAKGTPIGPHDVLIAGTALAYRATLITHNVNEFSRVEGLRFEDWYVG